MSRNNNRKFITSPLAGTGERRDVPVSFVLLAENHGYRMKSYGPISLVRIGKKTLIERQVEAIKASFVNYEVIICSGFETSKIYNFVKKTFGNQERIRIVENQVYFHSNCCESIRLCLNNVMNTNIVVCGGGILLTPEYLNSIDLKTPSMLFQDQQQGEGFEIGVIDNHSKLEGLSLAVCDKRWTELTYLTGESLVQSFYNTVSNPEYKNRFLFEAINSWSGRRKVHMTKNLGSPIIKINTIKTLKKVNES